MSQEKRSCLFSPPFPNKISQKLEKHPIDKCVNKSYESAHNVNGPTVHHTQRSDPVSRNRKDLVHFGLLLCNSYKELPDTNSNFLIKMTLEMA